MLSKHQFHAANSTAEMKWRCHHFLEEPACLLSTFLGPRFMDSFFTSDMKTLVKGLLISSCQGPSFTEFSSTSIQQCNYYQPSEPRPKQARLIESSIWKHMQDLEVASHSQPETVIDIDAEIIEENK